ncbi:tetratricopeptide repeat protein [Methylobacterium segetis]|uniref:tetratricopeptide repeat protein n=1 Tax=Methylobacterium segetis TaxID=2488750 RepID=UPI001048B37E|nr:tetratricopeptide repeat protein [Methylobacterium segetis]
MPPSGSAARAGSGICGAAPNVWDLHRHSEADWRALFARRPQEAASWIRFAAGKGFRAAQLMLGQMHLDGTGVPRDAGAAYAWFARAAAIGSLEARNMVGRCHELGWGVPVDQAEALRHYRRAAAGGLAWAQYNVGCLLLYGTGVRRDHAEAARHFAAAAATGHAKAIGLLGRCHEEGWGTPVDRAAARACYRRAAEGGDCWGALNLGLLLAEGGRPDEAGPWFETALATATPNCLATLADALDSGRPAGFEGIALRARRALGQGGAEPTRAEPDVAAAAPPAAPARAPMRVALAVAAWLCLRRALTAQRGTLPRRSGDLPRRPVRTRVRAGRPGRPQVRRRPSWIPYWR